MFILCGISDSITMALCETYSLGKWNTEENIDCAEATSNNDDRRSENYLYLFLNSRYPGTLYSAIA